MKKTFVCLFAILAVLLCVSVNAYGNANALTAITENGYSAFYDVELNDYDAEKSKGPTWGNWTFDYNTAIAKNSDLPDFFAMSNIKIEENQSFIFEAKLKITGAAAGLVFGVPNNSDPGAGWYCLNIDKNASSTRLFSVNTGTVGTSNAYVYKTLDNSIFKEDFITL